MINRFYLLLLFVSLQIFVKETYQGQVIGAEPILDFSNTNFMTQIHLKLSIETSLTNTDYLKLVFPIPLHTKLTAAINSEQDLSHPKQLYMTWNELKKTDETPVYTTDQPGSLLTETVDSANYFLKFYYTNYTQYALEKDKFFILKFNITDTEALKLQKSGELSQIQAFTQSSVQSNAILYDSNPSFGFMFLENQPTEQLSLEVTYKDANLKRNLNTDLELFLDLSLSYPVSEFEDTMRVIFSVSDNSYVFTNTCSSVAKTTVPTIAAVATADLSCSINQQTNSVIFLIKKTAFEKQTKMRFSVFVKSPKKIVQNVDIITRLLYQYNPRILSQTVAADVLGNNVIDVKEHSITLGWGLQPDATLPFPLKLIRGTENGSYHPYNGVKVSFKLLNNSPTGQELRVNLNIKSEVAAYILRNSLSENLPAHPGKTVTCTELDIKTPLKRKISCTGVGQLLSTQTYHIAFRIFLPYDVYEPNTNTEDFGSISIDTSHSIEKWDNVFIVGRDPSLLQKYSANQDDSPVKTDITSFLDYLKSFDDIYLVAVAQDFPDYSSEIFPSFYASGTASEYGNIFLPKENLNFINYLKTFSDVWILQKNVRNTNSALDFIKLHDTAPVVSKSIPKNTLSFPSVNGKDWQSTAQDAQVSIVADQNTVPGGAIDRGLKKDAAAKMLLFNTKIPFADVTKLSSTANTDYQPSNNVGVFFVMNPLIQVPNPSLTSEWYVPPPANAAHNTASQQTITTSVNSYTLFKLTLKNSDAILGKMAQAVTADTQWGIRSFILNEFGSIYVDSRLMDFYICTIDKIDGPDNLETITSYVLINGFSLSSATFGSMTPEVSNFWTSDNVSKGTLTGEFAPIFFKLIETTQNAIPAANKKLAIFFDQGDGYFTNKHNHKVSCSSSQQADEQSCLLYPPSQKINKNDFQTFARFEIDITDATQVFQIMVPVKIAATISKVNIYIASLIPNPDYAGKPYSFINGVQRFTELTFTPDTVALPSPFYKATNSAAHFGIDPCAGAACTVGATVDNQAIKMAIDTTAIVANKKSQFTYIADYNFFDTGATISGWPLTAAGDPTPCLRVSYKFISTTKSQMRYGLACTWFSQALGGTNGVVISKFILPTFSGLTLNGFGAISDATGSLAALVPNEYVIATTQTIATFSGITITPNMKQSVLKWQLTIPVTLERNFLIRIESITNPFTFSQVQSASCKVLMILSGQTAVLEPDVKCAPSFPTTSALQFSITNLQQSLPKNAQLIIVQHGIESAATGANDTFNIFLKYKETPHANDFIAKNDVASPGAITYDAAKQPSQLTLSQFSSNTLSQNAKSFFSFQISIISKKLWPGESFLFNLGQLAFNNQFDVNDLECTILNQDKKTANHDFEILSLGSLNNLTVKVRNFIDSFDSSYFLSCSRFLIPTDQNSGSISASLLSTANLSILTSTPLVLPSFTTNNPNIYENTMKKYLGTPGSNLELEFKIQSSKLNIDSKSRVVILFPKYYAPKLSRDDSLSCYYKNIRIACIITKDRQLEIKYFPNEIPAKQEITVVVAGVTQPQDYQVGKFFVAFDDDYDDTSYIEYGQLNDQGLESQGSQKAGLLGTLEIRNFQVQSTYLRATNIKYTFTMNYPSNYPSIKYGQVVMINFPQIYQYVLQDLKPSCQMKRKGSDTNYAGACQIQGLRVKIYVKEEMSSGFDYIIELSNIRNPGEFKPTSFKWILEISDSQQSKVLYRSIESSTNFIMKPFIQNPNQNYMFYQDGNSNPITQLNVIKGVRSQPIYIARESGQNVFARSFVLQSQISSIKTSPLQIEVNVGTTNKFFYVQSQDAIGEYAFKLSKEGDGDYYSNLPVLFLRFDDRNTEIFQLSRSQINVYSNEKISNYLIFFGITCLPPMEEVQVSFSIKAGQSDIGVEIWEQFNVDKITAQKSFGVIPLRIKDQSKFKLGQSIDISYNITGKNAQSYTIPATPVVKINVVNEPSANVTATVDFATPTQNTEDVTVKCTHNGIFYHQLYLGNYGTQCIQSDKALFEGAWGNYTQNDLHIKCESEYGIIGIYEQNAAQIIKYKNLKADTQYTFVGKCVSQSGQESEKVTKSFTTKGNGGQLGKIQFDFKEKPSIEQETKLSCFLALYFTSHPELVTTNSKTLCTEIHYAANQQKQRRRNLVEGLTCTEPNVVSTLEEGSYHSLTFYFSSNYYVNSDDLKSRLQAATALKCFKQFVQDHSKGIPTILNVHNAVFIDETPPSIVGTPKIYTGVQWAAIDNFELSGQGRVFASLEKQQIDGQKPSVDQVMNGLDAGNAKSVASTSYIIQSNAKEFNHTFTPLEKNQKYTLYYVIGQESPFLNLKTGEVQSIEFNTNNIPSEYVSILKFGFSLFCAIISVYILL